MLTVGGPSAMILREEDAEDLTRWIAYEIGAIIKGSQSPIVVRAVEDKGNVIKSMR